MVPRLECYFDYRSPFPYLAIRPVGRLAEKFGVEVEWIAGIERHEDLEAKRVAERLGAVHLAGQEEPLPEDQRIANGMIGIRHGRPQAL